MLRFYAKLVECMVLLIWFKPALPVNSKMIPKLRVYSAIDVSYGSCRVDAPCLDAQENNRIRIRIETGILIEDAYLVWLGNILDNMGKMHAVVCIRMRDAGVT